MHVFHVQCVQTDERPRQFRTGAQLTVVVPPAPHPDPCLTHWIVLIRIDRRALSNACSLASPMSSIPKAERNRERERERGIFQPIRPVINDRFDRTWSEVFIILSSPRHNCAKWAQREREEFKKLEQFSIQIAAAFVQLRKRSSMNETKC